MSTGDLDGSQDTTDGNTDGGNAGGNAGGEGQAQSGPPVEEAASSFAALLQVFLAQVASTTSDIDVISSDYVVRKAEAAGILPQDLVVFRGFLGHAVPANTTHRRLYLSLQLNEYIEFENTDVVVVKTDVGWGLTSTMLWLKRSAVVEHVHKNSISLQKGFLQGDISLTGNPQGYNSGGAGGVTIAGGSFVCGGGGGSFVCGGGGGGSFVCGGGGGSFVCGGGGGSFVCGGGGGSFVCGGGGGGGTFICGGS